MKKCSPRQPRRLAANLMLTILAATLMAACQGPPVPAATTTRTMLVSTDTPAATQTPTSLPLTGTPAPTRVTSTPRPSATFTPTPELLACPDTTLSATAPQPLTLLYTNEDTVWLWDEASGASTQVPLPDDAIAPLVSDDGRFVAFLQQGQGYDTAAVPVLSIPLWLLDRDTGQTREIASFETTETRQLHPDSPSVVLQMEWLPGGHWLLVQVRPGATGTGILHPMGDLYLVNAATGARQLILRGGQYEYYSLRPDGQQIAALDTAARLEDGTANWDALSDGSLILIDVPPESNRGRRDLPVRLPDDAWAIVAPAYSPDGAQVVVNSATGFAIVDTRQGVVREIPFENTCKPDECYWTRMLPVLWHPDGESFLTWTAINDYFDERAETTLSQIYLEPGLSVQTFATVRAGGGSFEILPDWRILAYWNQPDVETWQANPAVMNWVTLSLMDVLDGRPHRYAAQYLLRISGGWSPDNQSFVFSYSRQGGANPSPRRLALGHVCQPPRALGVPDGQLIDRIEWLDATRFLAWTLPADGVPDRYHVGLYLYQPALSAQPLHIDDLLRDGLRPYGMQSQVIVLE